MKLLISTLAFMLMCLIVVACAGSSPTSPTTTSPAPTNTNVSNVVWIPDLFPASFFGVWTNSALDIYPGFYTNSNTWVVTVSATEYMIQLTQYTNGVTNYYLRVTESRGAYSNANPNLLVVRRIHYGLLNAAGTILPGTCDYTNEYACMMLSNVPGSGLALADIGSGTLSDATLVAKFMTTNGVAPTWARSFYLK